MHLGDVIDGQVLIDDKGAGGVHAANGGQQRLARGLVDGGVVNDRQARLHVVKDLAGLGGGEVARLRSTHRMWSAGKKHRLKSRHHEVTTMQPKLCL